MRCEFLQKLWVCFFIAFMPALSACSSAPKVDYLNDTLPLLTERDDSKWAYDPAIDVDILPGRTGNTPIYNRRIHDDPDYYERPELDVEFKGFVSNGPYSVDYVMIGVKRESEVVFELIDYSAYKEIVRKAGPDDGYGDWLHTRDISKLLSLINQNRYLNLLETQGVISILERDRGQVRQFKFLRDDVGCLLHKKWADAEYNLGEYKGQNIDFDEDERFDTQYHDTGCSDETSNEISAEEGRFVWWRIPLFYDQEVMWETVASLTENYVDEPLIGCHVLTYLAKFKFHDYSPEQSYTDKVFVGRFSDTSKLANDLWDNSLCLRFEFYLRDD